MSYARKRKGEREREREREKERHIILIHVEKKVSMWFSVLHFIF